MNLQKYLGLKHKFGADPRDGKAADCLLLCFALLDEGGIPRPAMNPEWIEMAKAGFWNSLEIAWNNHTTAIDKPEPFAVSMHWNRPRLDHPRLGICTLVESGHTPGIVMIHARKGVVWLPLSTPGLPSFQFRKFKA